jgi:hypothetical protein
MLTYSAKMRHSVASRCCRQNSSKRPPAAICCNAFRLPVIGHPRGSDGGFRLVSAASAHRSPGAPIGLGVYRGLGKPELVAQPPSDMLKGRGLWCRPHIPVRPVLTFDRRGQRLFVAPRNPMRPQPGMFGDRDQRVVVVVLLEVHLDRDVVGGGCDDSVHRRDRCRVPDEQVAGRRLVRCVEARRAHQRHGRDRRAGLHGLRPRRRRAGWVVQHNVDREPAGGDVRLGDRVCALELGIRPARVGKPEPQPRRPVRPSLLRTMSATPCAHARNVAQSEQFRSRLPCGRGRRNSVKLHPAIRAPSAVLSRATRRHRHNKRRSPSPTGRDELHLAPFS